MADSGTTGPGHSPALILATLCSANVMATMDLSIVNVSLHSIGVGFGGEVLSNVAWVLSAYDIVFGAPRWCQPVGSPTATVRRAASSSACRCSRWRACVVP
jgi:hypothetical protein